MQIQGIFGDVQGTCGDSQGTFQPEEDQLGVLLEAEVCKFREYSATFREHSATFREHSAIVREHSDLKRTSWVPRWRWKLANSYAADGAVNS